MTSKTTLYAFFLRTGSMFEEIISTTTTESWEKIVRENAQMPDAAVVLIQTNVWKYPRLASTDAEI